MGNYLEDLKAGVRWTIDPILATYDSSFYDDTSTSDHVAVKAGIDPKVSYDDSSTPVIDGDSTLARQALDAWSVVASLSFVDSPTAQAAKFAILSAPLIEGLFGRTARSDSPDPPNLLKKTSLAASVIQSDGIGNPGTINTVALYLHEIGLAIGLQTPRAPGDLTPSYAEGHNPDYSQDTTIMSYNNGVQVQYDGGFQHVTGAAPVLYAATPMIYDIAVIQDLYGANLTTTAGNNQYVLGSHPFQARTIWDADGIDEITVNDVSLTAPATIDLRGGLDADGRPNWSHFGNEYLDIAFDSRMPGGVVSIEKAVSGAGDDTIFDGPGGNTLTGGAGDDTFIYDGPVSTDDVTTDFAIGDQIDFRGVGLATSVTLATGNVLTLTMGSGSPITLQLHPLLDYSRDIFTVSADGSGGSTVELIAKPVLLDQSRLFYNGGTSARPLTGYSTWQSFTAGLTGDLTEIDAGFFNPISGSATLIVRSGIGMGGAILSTTTVSVASSGSGSLNFSAWDVDVPVAAGSHYTFQLIPGPGIPDPYGVANSGIATDPDYYPGGTFGVDDPTGSYPVDTDWVFRTYVMVNEPIACFRSGTLIGTPKGSRPVDDLRVGDLVDARVAGIASVTWIGRRTVSCLKHPNPEQVWPVRISPDAFGIGLPCRDLWLSPDHAVFIAGVLIPIRTLINGTTIAQVPVDEVTYHHIELARHDVVLAEGLSCESYLDSGDRSNFESDGPTRLFADFASSPSETTLLWESKACAPLVVHGPVFEAVQALVNARATEPTFVRMVA